MGLATELTDNTSVIRQAVTSLDAAVVVPRVSTMREVRDRAFRAERVTALLLLAGAGTAGLVSLAGLHALTSVVFFARRAEFAVRSALGATPTDLALLMARHGWSLTLIGVLLGLFISYVVAPWAASLVRPETFSLTTGLVASTAIILASGLAVLWPAVRLCRNPASSYGLLH